MGLCLLVGIMQSPLVSDLLSKYIPPPPAGPQVDLDEHDIGTEHPRDHGVAR